MDSSPKLTLFNRAAYFSKPCLALLLQLPKGTDKLITDVTAAHYTQFIRRKHGLILGQLSKEVPPGYDGPVLQFIYKVTSEKVAFLHLQLNGYSEADLVALEQAFDL